MSARAPTPLEVWYPWNSALQTPPPPIGRDEAKIMADEILQQLVE